MNLKTILAIAAFLAAGGAAVWYNMSVAPTGHSMEVPDLSSIDIGDPIASVNLPASLSPDAIVGKRIFDAKCAVCHGENAAGTNGTAPPLIHRFYRPGHHSDASFIRAAKVGVQAHHWNFGNMPPVSGVTDGDVKLVVRYVREIQRANGIQ